MRNPKIRFVIADGGRARFVDRDPESGHYRTVQSLLSDTVHDRAHDLGHAAPTRVHESAAAARHAVDARQDLHTVAERDFARTVGKLVEAATRRGEFDRLVLVAPARVLPEIRAELSREVLARGVTELQKDLTKVPDGDLADHLKETARHAML